MRLKDPLLDHDISKLQGEVLANVPKDPWGNPYYFDWINERIVCTGPDALLTTPVPGLRVDEGIFHDDETFQVLGLPDFVMGYDVGDVGVIALVAQDGSSPLVLAEFPATHILDLDAIATGEVIVAAVKRGRKNQLISLKFQHSISQLRNLDVPPEPVVEILNEGEFEIASPTLYASANDWVFFCSDQGAASGFNPHDIFRVGYRERALTNVTENSNDCISPSVDRTGKIIYFSSRVGENYQIRTFTIATMKDSQVFMEKRQSDLLNPSPSNRGDKIAFLERTGRQTVLRVVEVKSKRELFYSDEVLSRSSIVWSADDRRIAYHVPREDRPVLVITQFQPAVTMEVDSRDVPLKASRFAWVQH